MDSPNSLELSLPIIAGAIVVLNTLQVSRHELLEMVSKIRSESDPLALLLLLSSYRGEVLILFVIMVLAGFTYLIGAIFFFSNLGEIVPKNTIVPKVMGIVCIFIGLGCLLGAWYEVSAQCARLRELVREAAKQLSTDAASYYERVKKLERHVNICRFSMFIRKPPEEI